MKKHSPEKNTNKKLTKNNATKTSIKKKSVGESQSVHDKFYEVYDEYKKQYDKPCILMQVGGFFEMYSPPDYSRGNAKEIAPLLNCELTKKSNGILMSGFPLHSLDKNIARLVDLDYTVIIIEQSTSLDDQLGLLVEMRGKARDLATRKVTQIISKSTQMDNNRLRNNIMSISCKSYGIDNAAGDDNNGQLEMSIAVVDTMISNVIHYSHVSSNDRNDRANVLDIMIRFVLQYNPVECILMTENGEIPNIIKDLSIMCPIIKRDVQNIEERDIFQDYLPSVNNALGGLIMFLRQHDPTDRLYSRESFKIQPYVSKEHMELSSTAINQLDLEMFLSSKELNKTITFMGNRLLYNRVLNPILLKNEIERRYDMIEDSKNMNVAIKKTIKDELFLLPDLDKLYRKLSFGRCTFGQFRRLHDSFLVLKESDTLLSESLKNALSCMMDEYLTSIRIGNENDVDTLNENGKNVDDMNENGTGNVDIDGSFCTRFFQTGAFTDLDDLFGQREKHLKVVFNFIEKASSVIPDCDFKVKDIGIETTHIRGDKIVKNLKCQIHKSKNFSIVYDENLRDALQSLKILYKDIESLSKKLFEPFQINFFKKNQSFLEKISLHVAELDVAFASESIATKYRLVRPVISEEESNGGGKNMFHISGLRHLLIENLNPSIRYIPNDCKLTNANLASEKANAENDTNKHTSISDKYGVDNGIIGYMIYGVNSCGKTSYLKSAGLAAIFAQAGLFVPARSMTFTPFERIITRIAGSDNMARSQSSFIVELEELLSILQRGNSRTFVLGDEMCRGTEISSANAIVHTMISFLAEHEIFFLAATHLHDIAPRLLEIPGVSVFHMRVNFDDAGEPEFERSLVSGSGPDRYGLEVAKAMKFPVDFLEKASRFRLTSDVVEKECKEYAAILIKEKKSNYNKKKILVVCENCKYTPQDEYHLPLDTHHLSMQCQADSGGFHGSQHKDVLHNLVALCKLCHVAVHKKKLAIVEKQTLKGRKLIFEDK